MTKWTVYKVGSLLSGGAGQSLQKLGQVEAADYPEAMDKAHAAYSLETNPTLPQGGLTVIATRSVA